MSEIAVESKKVETPVNTGGQDTGLGFKEFLDRGSIPPKEIQKTESQEGEKTPSPEPKSEEIKAGDQKAVDNTEVKVKDKADETEKKSGSETKSNWDDDENPYRKRYQDTAKWANSINQQNMELKKSLEIINKKLDGTYEPEKEKQAIDPDVLTKTSDTLGRVKASLAASIDKYKDKGGIKYIEKMLYADDAPFRAYDDNDLIQTRVLSSSLPVMEAMKVLEEAEFVKKWGNDPDSIETAIRKKTEEELEAKLTEKITKQIMGRIDQKERLITGVGDARSAETVSKTDPNARTPLKSIFPNF